MSTATAVRRPRLWFGQAATRLRPRAAFASTAQNREHMRLHRVADVDGHAIWQGGKVTHLVVGLKCGKVLTRARLHVEPPADLELCDYCALADELGPAGFAAAGIVARLSALPAGPGPTHPGPSHPGPSHPTSPPSPK